MNLFGEVEQICYLRSVELSTLAHLHYEVFSLSVITDLKRFPLLSCAASSISQASNDADCGSEERVGREATPAHLSSSFESLWLLFDKREPNPLPFYKMSVNR